jgi:hypothetical protein
MIIVDNFSILYCNVTNTWEFKTITFPGDTTGAFNNDNGTSLTLRFWLGAGSILFKWNFSNFLGIKCTNANEQLDKLILQIQHI